MIDGSLPQNFPVPASTVPVVVPFQGVSTDDLTIADGVVTAQKDMVVHVAVNAEWRTVKDVPGQDTETGYRVLSIFRDTQQVESVLADTDDEHEVTRHEVNAIVKLVAGQELTVRARHDYSEPVTMFSSSSTGLTVVEVIPEEALIAVQAQVTNLAASVNNLAAALAALQDVVNGANLSADLAGLPSATIVAEGGALGFYGSTAVEQQAALTPAVEGGVDLVTVLGISVLGGNTADAVENNALRIAELEDRLTAYGLLDEGTA